MRTIGRDFGDTARKVYAVASGALGNGKTCVVNADGTVSVIVESSASASLGSATVFETSSNEANVAWISDTQLVVAWALSASSYYGQAVVGTVSGTSITFGSVVTFESAQVSYVSICSIGSSQVVVTWRDYANSNYGTTAVGTVSGTSISFGSHSVFNQGLSEFMDIVDIGSSKVVIAYQDGSNSDQGSAVVGTVSGTSISFGSEVVFNSGGAAVYEKITFIGSDKVVIAFRDGTASNLGYAIVGTVSGTSISFGTKALFEGGASAVEYLDIASVGNNQVVTVVQDVDNSNYGTAAVGTVSGTSISFGTPVVYQSVNCHYNRVSSPSTGKVVIAYTNASNGQGTSRIGTVSGTSISFADGPNSGVFESGNTSHIGMDASTSTGKAAIVYRDAGDSNKGKVVIYQTDFTGTNLTSENYIGISSGSVTYVNEGLGSVVEFDTTSGMYPRGASNGNGTILVVFRYSNGVVRGIVGVISGSSVTFGDPVAIHDGNSDQPIGVVYDPDSDKFIVSYKDDGDSGKGKAVVITVSGTSISQGSHVTFEAGTASDQVLVYDTNSNKVVIIYRDANDDAFGIVGTVSGTSISFGSASSFDTGNLRTFSAAFDSSNNKIVVAYQDYENNRYGTSAVGTVSGTSISFGTPVVFESATTPINGVIFDSNSNKIGIFYRDAGNNSYLTGIVGTVSGTSISFGSSTATSQAIGDGCSASFSSGLNTIKVAVETNSDAIVYYVATISGTSVSFGSQVVLENSQEGSNPFTFYNTSNNAATVFLYQDEGFDGNIRIYAEFSSSGTTADGATALIDTKGAINDNQNALTAGQSYFVQTDGTLGTTAGDPSVFAGTAVSATKIIVKG